MAISHWTPWLNPVDFYTSATLREHKCVEIYPGECVPLHFGYTWRRKWGTSLEQMMGADRLTNRLQAFLLSSCVFLGFIGIGVLAFWNIGSSWGGASCASGHSCCPRPCIVAVFFSKGVSVSFIGNYLGLYSAHHLFPSELSMDAWQRIFSNTLDSKVGLGWIFRETQTMYRFRNSSS